MATLSSPLYGAGYIGMKLRRARHIRCRFVVHEPEATRQALQRLHCVGQELGVGGMVLARGLDDEDLADDIRNAAHKHALKIASWREHRLREGKRRRPTIRRH